MLTTRANTVRCECGYKAKVKPVPGFVAACEACDWKFDGKCLVLRKGTCIEFHEAFNQKQTK